MSPAEARMRASSFDNHIRISQPHTAETSSSHSFAVHSDWTTEAVGIQGASGALSALNNRWRRGVGLGVGIGVPILMGLTALATYMATKKRNRSYTASPK